MSLEVFKPILSWEEYSVSTWGRVFSHRKGEFLIPETTSKGYLRVKLWKNAKATHKKVHRLVAEAFLPNPLGKPQVNHIDGNKQNNSVTNLEWVTDEENKLHASNVMDVIMGEEIGRMISYYAKFGQYKQ